MYQEIYFNAQKREIGMEIITKVAVTGLTMMSCTCGFDQKKVTYSFGEPGYKVNLSL
jgi:hypothetical protein